MVLKIFMCGALSFAVAAGVWFMLAQGDKKNNIESETAPVISHTEPLRIYTEEEKIKILQDLAGATPTSTVKKEPVATKVTNSTLSAEETQKRIQALKQISVPVDTTSPSDEEKLRILNSLSGATQ